MITLAKQKAFREDLLEELYNTEFFPEEYRVVTRIHNLEELIIYTAKLIPPVTLEKVAKRNKLIVIGFHKLKTEVRKYKYYLEEI